MSQTGLIELLTALVRGDIADHRTQLALYVAATEATTAAGTDGRPAEASTALRQLSQLRTLHPDVAAGLRREHGFTLPPQEHEVSDLEKWLADCLANPEVPLGGWDPARVANLDDLCTPGQYRQVLTDLDLLSRVPADVAYAVATQGANRNHEVADLALRLPHIAARVVADDTQPLGTRLAAAASPTVPLAQLRRVVAEQVSIVEDREPIGRGTRNRVQAIHAQRTDLDNELTAALATVYLYRLSHGIELPEWAIAAARDAGHLTPGQLIHKILLAGATVPLEQHLRQLWEQLDEDAKPETAHRILRNTTVSDDLSREALTRYLHYLADSGVTDVADIDARLLRVIGANLPKRFRPWMHHHRGVLLRHLATAQPAVDWDTVLATCAPETHDDLVAGYLHALARRRSTIGFTAAVCRLDRRRRLTAELLAQLPLPLIELLVSEHGLDHWAPRLREVAARLAGPDLATARSRMGAFLALDTEGTALGHLVDAAHAAAT